MTVILRKELRRLFGGIRGFAVIAILLLFCGLYTVLQNMLTGSTSFAMSLGGAFPALIITVPLLTAPTFADEKRTRSLPWLYSLGFRTRDVVIGKYLAHLTVYLISMLVVALYPLILSFFGEVPFSESYFAWFGLFLLGALLLSLCLLISTLLERAWLNWIEGALAILSLYLLNVYLTALPASPWFSFVVLEGIAFSICLWIWLVAGSWLVAACTAVLPAALAILFVCAPSPFRALFPLLLSLINPFSRFSGFIYGRLDLQGILYFLSATALLLTITVCILVYRRDREILMEKEDKKP